MEYEKYFQYFDRPALNFYRTNSHVYELTEDDMGGEITISDQWNEGLENQFPYMTLLIYSDFENQNTLCCVILKHYTQYIVPIFLRS